MRIVILVFMCIHGLAVFGQFNHLSVFPEETGEDLLELLVNNYKPSSVPGLSEAKDIIYKDIYSENDSVSCVYSGHTLYLDPSQDPSTWLYKNGSPNGINAEHNFPKSKGAGHGNALSDLFNIFPSRTQVNADRGNFPFAEIIDTKTEFWYFNILKSNSIPSQNIDSYSELASSKFEPREDHKGNVARSVFYFVTMYENEVQQADSQFFENMKSTLCDWHYLDPVDSLEWLRNSRISNFQSGKKNPFVLDCSLAGRSYCDYIDDNCTTTNTIDLSNNVGLPCIVYPNPSKNHFFIDFPFETEGLLDIKLYNMLGHLMFEQVILEGQRFHNSHKVDLSEKALEYGIYYLELTLDAQNVKKLHRSTILIQN